MYHSPKFELEMGKDEREKFAYFLVIWLFGIDQKACVCRLHFKTKTIVIPTYQPVICLETIRLGSRALSYGVFSCIL